MHDPVRNPSDLSVGRFKTNLSQALVSARKQGVSILVSPEVVERYDTHYDTWDFADCKDKTLLTLRKDGHTITVKREGVTRMLVDFYTDGGICFNDQQFINRGIPRPILEAYRQHRLDLYDHVRYPGTHVPNSYVNGVAVELRNCEEGYFRGYTRMGGDAEIGDTRYGTLDISMWVDDLLEMVEMTWQAK